MTSRDIRLRIILSPETLIGSGKADLLEGIRDTGSIAAAGRAMGMSYKRAWYLLDTLNQSFGEPIVTTSKGGRNGGGAQLTATGLAVLEAFRRVETITIRAVAEEFAQLAPLMKPPDH